MTKKTHRFFHYDPDSGRSDPIEPVRLEDGTEVLVPMEAVKKIKRDVYGFGPETSPESADQSIEEWEAEN
jgi:predicted DNA-binding antitoxin AbrB/MazE fold protein